MAHTLEWDEGAILKSFFDVVSAKESFGVAQSQGQDPILEHFAAAREVSTYTISRGALQSEGQLEIDESEALRSAQLELQEAFAGAMSRAANGEVDKEEDEYWAAVLGDGNFVAPVSVDSDGGEATGVARRRASELSQLDGETRKRLRSSLDLQPRVVVAAASAAVKQSTGSSTATADKPTVTVSQTLAAPSTHDQSSSSKDDSTVSREERSNGLESTLSKAGEPDLAPALVELISRTAARVVTEMLLPPQSDAAAGNSARLSSLLQAWYHAGELAGRGAAAAEAAAAAASVAVPPPLPTED